MLPLLILLLLQILIEDRPRAEHVAIKDKEKLKNDKYSQRCQMIDSDFMPMALKSMVLALRNLQVS